MFAEVVFAKLDEVEKRYEKVYEDLQRPGVTENTKNFASLTKELANLKKIVETYRDYKKVTGDIAYNRNWLANETDIELKAMAKEEVQSLSSRAQELEAELKILLMPKDPHDERDIILEIRAGAGGDEASLFAEELFRAYTLYSQGQGWKTSILSISAGNVGGVKEIIATIAGDKVYSRLKYESGVHRVQRVPKTETQGRIHTSTVTVAVIPEVQEVEIKIDPKDIRIDVFRSSGHGGQSVNTTDSAVRITHLPSGLVVSCQDGKSQLSNKEKAMMVLYSRLQALEDERARKEASETRLAQIGTGDRSERIRTYNFPQSRITDHRIGFTTHNIQDVMNGKFESVIDPVAAHYQAEILKNQEKVL